MSDCLFCRLVAGAIPCQKVYEDEEILAFRDISPARPVHVLLIPKKHIASLMSATSEDAPLLGRMLARANAIAVAEGSPDGFRVIINSGRVGQQEVQHLHIHIVGGPDPVGPMLKRIQE
ncbi:MAG: histidine triad nucleotide-binding protein [Betaproteobacteria bacterium]|nr:histidine triad nucleotide-binding protein [Betaproteobacteria bacterium]